MSTDRITDKWSPFYDSVESTTDEFLSKFGDRLKRSAQGVKDEALFGSLLNLDPVDRVAIANFVLDAGANAGALGRSDRSSVLHLILSGDRVRDFELEAPLLKRLLEGGADINYRSARSGFPLEKLSGYPFDEEELAPFYDVIFSGNYIDPDVVTNKHYGSTPEVPLHVITSARPELVRRIREYVKKRNGGTGTDVRSGVGSA